MAILTCPSCQEPNGADATVCEHCGYFLADAPATVLERTPTPPDPRPDSPPTDPPAAAAPPHCPICGADVPDPGNRVCVVCLEPLSPIGQPGRASPARTRREPDAGGRRLLLRFGGCTITVTGDAVLLGRDTASPAAALLAARDNVSRRHASVAVDQDGRAWVRDEYSANGTFVNDDRVPPGGRHALVDGDELRMASDVVARIEHG